MHDLKDYKVLLEHIAGQIPSKVCESIKLRIRMDAFGVAPVLIVTDSNGREWREPLDSEFYISDRFKAWLCVIE